MKMDILCQSCDKKYKTRATYEKHRDICKGKQPKRSMMNMIIALTKRVEYLENQVKPHDSPTISLQEFLKTDFKINVDCEGKVLNIYSDIIQKMLNYTDCMEMRECIYVFDDGWVCLRDYKNIEQIVCCIKTKLINILIQKEDFKNMSKITGFDTKQIIKMIKQL